jgi:hypothetical protein
LVALRTTRQFSAGIPLNEPNAEKSVRRMTTAALRAAPPVRARRRLTDNRCRNRPDP